MAMSVLVVDASLVNTWIASVVVIGSDVGDPIGCKRAYLPDLLGYAVGARPMALTRTVRTIGGAR